MRRWPRSACRPAEPARFCSAMTGRLRAARSFRGGDSEVDLTRFVLVQFYCNDLGSECRNTDPGPGAMDCTSEVRGARRLAESQWNPEGLA